jgi:hypothetical protein
MVDRRGDLLASRIRMRCPADWPRGTALMADCIMFSDQPKA